MEFENVKKCHEKSGKRSNFVLEKSGKTIVRLLYEPWWKHLLLWSSVKTVTRSAVYAFGML